MKNSSRRFHHQVIVRRDPDGDPIVHYLRRQFRVRRTTKPDQHMLVGSSHEDRLRLLDKSPHRRPASVYSLRLETAVACPSIVVNCASWKHTWHSGVSIALGRRSEKYTTLGHGARKQPHLHASRDATSRAAPPARRNCPVRQPSASLSVLSGRRDQLVAKVQARRSAAADSTAGC